ncbi:MAG TPA: DUF1302 family protein, partial [Pseudomonadales bacterium]|nr:DUF1302 family protein [Pseudomonadales bacterium]
NARLGKQVINWGEGLLFANGINSINPIDVNALLAPGSEVKDALIPLNAVYASIGVTQSLTLEAFGLLEWRETVLPACGTFFSQTDLVGSGCWAGFIPNGWEPGYQGTVSGVSTSAANITLPRGKDITPDSHDQFGIAARIMADSIGTEFGLYFTQLNSNLPVVSGHTPDVTRFLYNGTPFPFASLNAARQTLVGLTNNPLATIALLPYGDYVVEFPEHIKLFGASFNTTMNLGLPGGDTSVSGEISVRKDQPFAIEDGDALAGAVGLPSLSCANSPTPYDCYSEFKPGEYRPGYFKTDYYQAEMVFLHFFDQVLGADRWTAAFDIAGSYLKLPDRDKGLLNSAYNATLNFPNMPNVNWTTPGVGAYGTLPYSEFIQMTEQAFAADGNLHNTVTRQEHDYATSSAWGYKIRVSGDYNNVFAGVNLRPTISFSHDVRGTTPTPVTNFLQNRKAVGLALDAIYQNNYTIGVAYNDFFGAEPYNSMADRDYYTISASAAF